METKIKKDAQYFEEYSASKKKDKERISKFVNIVFVCNVIPILFLKKKRISLIDLLGFDSR